MERIDDLIEYLRGTCNSLDSGCVACDIEVTDLTPAELEEIDDEIFQCDECSWWCDAHEMNIHANGVDRLCDDCAPGSEE